MEQLKIKSNNTTSQNSKDIECDLECIPQCKGVLFNIKNHSLVQQSLINTLLNKNNLSIEDLACILHVDAKKFNRVLQGEETLSEKEAFDLVHLFYSLFR